MPTSQQFSYIATNDAWGEAGLMPYVPLKLSHENQSINEYALVDSGSTINVMPFSTGIRLGLDWEQQSKSITD